MSNREAIDTITGYFYQFDKTILELLLQDDDEASICIEGIEDIDVITADEISAVQCKYYAKTEYNHSVIKKPITLMLRHFSYKKTTDIKYHLYGHYKSGHEKLGTITPQSLKENYLTYSKKSKETNKTTVYKVHEELGLNDDDLSKFIELLTIDINAPSLDDQYSRIIEIIKTILNVSAEEAEFYHYNSALKLVKNLSIRQKKDDRYITKRRFIEHIKSKDEIFDSWFIRRKGRESYIKSVRKERLSTGLNMEPFDRFFLLDCCKSERLEEIKEVIFLVVAKWSKISKRQNPSFCPGIYIHGLSSEKKIELKKNMYAEGWHFIDGYPFRGAELTTLHFYEEPTVENKIRFKFVDNLEDLSILLSNAKRTVEVYQLYNEKIFFSHDGIKMEKIKIEAMDYIKDMTK